MKNAFSSIVRQSWIRKYLQSPTLSSILKSSSKTVTEELEEVREKISTFTPQGPTIEISEEDTVEHLHEAVIGAYSA